ncbi:MCE family protein [Mycobacterium sp. E796]|uniref:MCE family protein n=1 Tax=Mycobacterium sp. E796 TaxID=1834151 RepID=UPI0008015CE8|nr:MCE family protein [Mycobacterium sp. E796]OBI70527.1 MCE-family protein MCE3A [Mycobacterium sp. E796]
MTVATKRRVSGLHPAWWTGILLAVIAAIGMITPLAFNRDFRSYAKVTLAADRSGLVMDPYAKVKYRGVLVGRVKAIRPGSPVRLDLEIYSSDLRYIPANVGAKITAPTAFGSKYVELVAPDNPSSRQLTSGATLFASKVSDETNTTFSNLVEVLDKIDVTKLHAVLSAWSDALRGKGQQIGEAITDANQYLSQLNSRSDTIRQDWRAFKGFNDTYASAAKDLLRVLDAASTTSTTITDDAKSLDSLLVNVTGLSNGGINLIGPNRDNLVQGVNMLEPTTRLLMKYNPELTCTLLGGQNLMTNFKFLDNVGGNGYSVILDAGLLFGDDPYKYPDNLPITGQKGGPGGKPGCGSLPDVSNNWPVRYVVTNSGYGTGNDIRINPGIGFPGWANYFPTTRGTPQPPSLKNTAGGPAPGPVPYPGAPQYGAQQYAPDGAPLYPGLPSAPPPGQPRDPGPVFGLEPFTPAHPMEVQPTPVPIAPPPLPAAAPSPASPADELAPMDVPTS